MLKKSFLQTRILKWLIVYEHKRRFSVKNYLSNGSKNLFSLTLDLSRIKAFYELYIFQMRERLNVLLDGFFEMIPIAFR